MKKRGFTLAEILISMAVIGVVAAMCVPTLGVSARKKANLATLKVTTSDIETAFGTMLATYGEQEIKQDWIDKGTYKKYLKMDGDKTKNGSQLIGFDGIDKEFTIDVNGKGVKPDREFYDVFKCKMDSYGLITCETENETNG